MSPVALALAAALAAADAPLAAPLAPGSKAASRVAAGPDAAAAPEVLKRLMERARPTLVTLGDDPWALGFVVSESGIVVAPAGKVGADGTTVVFSNGFRAKAALIARDEGLGLALLFVPGMPPVASLRLASENAELDRASYGVRIARPGQPQLAFARVGSTEVVRSGAIESRIFTARFAADARAVGGPVLAFDGSVLGMQLAHDRSGTAFIASVEAIHDLMEANAGALPTLPLAIESTPPGAEVRLDGVVVGKTPLLLPAVPLGRHTARLTLAGRPDGVRQVVVGGSSKQRIEVELKGGAPVEVVTEPLAELRVDGVLLLRGSGSLWLADGRRQLVLSAPGRRTVRRSLEVAEGRPLRLEMPLDPARAQLSVETVPPGATATLDAQVLGKTPLALTEVAPGSRVLQLSAPGFATRRIPLVLRDEAKVDLGRVTLERPAFTAQITAPRGTTIAVDGEAPRPLRVDGERLPPGEHRYTLLAPYQYRVEGSLQGREGEVVRVQPPFVAAGVAEQREVWTTLGWASEGAAGLLALVSGGLFLFAETGRSSDTGLDASGRSAVKGGFIAGGGALGLYALGLFLTAQQPTPDMGHERVAP